MCILVKVKIIQSFQGLKEIDRGNFVQKIHNTHSQNPPGRKYSMKCILFIYNIIYVY